MNDIHQWIDENLPNIDIFSDVIEREEDLTDSLVITKQYLNKEDWNNYIHHFVAENRCGYMDAIIDYAETNGLEIETVSKLVDSNIKEFIRLEAEESNLMPRIGRLDFED